MRHKLFNTCMLMWILSTFLGCNSLKNEEKYFQYSLSMSAFISCQDLSERYPVVFHPLMKDGSRPQTSPRLGRYRINQTSRSKIGIDGAESLNNRITRVTVDQASKPRPICKELWCPKYWAWVTVTEELKQNEVQAMCEKDINESLSKIGQSIQSFDESLLQKS